MKLREHVFILVREDGSIIRDRLCKGVYLSFGVAKAQARNKARHRPVLIKRFTLTDGEVVHTEEARICSQ